MNELTVINQNGQLTVDSREVAHMVDKEHKNLLRDIKGYCIYLNSPANMVLGSKLSAANFFIESTYKNENNQKYPCYLLTKKGCDMVANKMTGEKGVLFTAAYVTKFEEMEKQIQAPMQQLSPQLQLLINMELEQKKLRQQLNEVNHNALQAKAETEKVKEEVQAIRDVIVINPKAEWRKQTNDLIRYICIKRMDFETPRIEIYKALEQRGVCNMKQRLKNLQGRALLNGMAKSKADELNNLDVLENEPRLKEIYIAIVKEMAIRYKVA